MPALRMHYGLLWEVGDCAGGNGAHVSEDIDVADIGANAV
jgi:hypothetical protein